MIVIAAIGILSAAVAIACLWVEREDRRFRRRPWLEELLEGILLAEWLEAEGEL